MLTTKANIQSKLLTIQQVAAMTMITPRQLRYWERYGIVKPKFVEKGKREDRRYSLRDIAVLRKALQLRKKKMSIRRLAKIIKNPGLQFSIKAYDIEQKFNKERPRLIKEALALLLKGLQEKVSAWEAKHDPNMHNNNDYVQLISKVEQIHQLLIELE